MRHAILCSIGAALFASVAALGSAVAQTAPSLPGQPPALGTPPPSLPEPPDIEQVQLDNAAIDRFIAAWPDMAKLANDLEARYGTETGAPANNPMAAFSSYMKNSVAQDQMMSVLRSHGFSDPKEWVATGYSIVVAIFTIESGPLDAQMAESLRHLEQMDMPAEQKAMLRQQMQTQIQMMSGLTNPLPGNTETVGPRAEELKAFFEQLPRP